jgi:hypothetical protein
VTPMAKSGRYNVDLGLEGKKTLDELIKLVGMDRKEFLTRLMDFFGKLDWRAQTAILRPDAGPDAAKMALEKLLEAPSPVPNRAITAEDAATLEEATDDAVARYNRRGARKTQGDSPAKRKSDGGGVA